MLASWLTIISLDKINFKTHVLQLISVILLQLFCFALQWYSYLEDVPLSVSTSIVSTAGTLLKNQQPFLNTLKECFITCDPYDTRCCALIKCEANMSPGMTPGTFWGAFVVFWIPPPHIFNLEVKQCSNYSQNIGAKCMYTYVPCAQPYV